MRISQTRSVYQSKMFTPARDMPAWLPWILGGSFILIVLFRDFLHSTGGLIDSSVYWGRDFINVWTGGHLIREGKVDVLYDMRAYSEFQRSLFGNIDPHNYSYPPVSYPLAVLFSMLPYSLALISWLAGTGALFVWAARPWWPERAGPAWLAILTPAAIINIWAGHYGFLIGALFLFGWSNLDRRPALAGVFFGLMLIKPHMAALIPLALLIRRDWLALASATATVSALVGFTTLFYGWESWHLFLFRTSGVQASMIDAGTMFFGIMSTSAATAVLRMTSDWPLAVTIQLMFTAAAIGMVVTAAIRKSSTRDLALLVATATFLALPYSFNYDLTVVMIGALTCIYRTTVTPTEHRLAIYGFVCPQVGMALSAFYVPLMPLALAGLAFVQFRQAIRGKDPILGRAGRAVAGAAH